MFAMSKYSICSLTIDPMTGSTREQEPNLHEVRETSVLTLYGVSTYTFAVAPSRARGLKLGCWSVQRQRGGGRALTGAWIETSII